MQATITKEKDGTEMLTIKIPVQTPKRSAGGTGKTMLIASETQKAVCQYDGHDITIGLNAYFKP